MALDGSEALLCLPRHKVEEVRRWDGFTTWDQDLVDWLMISAVPIPRTAELEADRDWLQLVSYGIVWTAGNSPGVRTLAPTPPRILTYRRPSKGTEDRLHGQSSLGVGGHVEESDTQDSRVETLRSAMDREAREELKLDPRWLTEVSPIGIIFDQSWEGVEAVHFGIAWEVKVPPIVISSGGCEESLSDVRWLTHSQIVVESPPEQWEKWSRILIDSHLAQGLRRVPKPLVMV